MQKILIFGIDSVEIQASKVTNFKAPYLDRIATIGRQILHIRIILSYLLCPRNSGAGSSVGLTSLKSVKMGQTSLAGLVYRGRAKIHSNKREALTPEETL